MKYLSKYSFVIKIFTYMSDHEYASDINGLVDLSQKCILENI